MQCDHEMGKRQVLLFLVFLDTTHLPHRVVTILDWIMLFKNLENLYIVEAILVLLCRIFMYSSAYNGILSQ